MTPTETPAEIHAEIPPEAPEIPAAHRAAVQRAIEIALETVKEDFSMRVPRSDEDRASGFAAWIARKRQQHDPMMRAAIAEALADAAPLDEMTAQKYVDCCVWPEVEFWLLDYCLRYYAGRWVQQHYGDAIYTTPVETLWLSLARSFRCERLRAQSGTDYLGQRRQRDRRTNDDDAGT